MDQTELVRVGHKLVELMDQTEIAPLMAMWVRKDDLEIWRLWILPSDSKMTEREFYRKVSVLITEHRDDFPNFEASDIELIEKDHPAIIGLSKLFCFPGFGEVSISNNTFNGFYLPEGVVLRLDLSPSKK